MGLDPLSWVSRHGWRVPPCECYWRCGQTTCGEDFLSALPTNVGALHLNCLLHDVDELCNNDDGCFSGICEEPVQCDAKTRAGCLAQSYNSGGSFHLTDSQRFECLMAVHPYAEYHMSTDNACGACVWDEVQRDEVQRDPCDSHAMEGHPGCTPEGIAQGCIWDGFACSQPAVYTCRRNENVPPDVWGIPYYASTVRYARYTPT